ncbi:tyrosine-type recombinase/integrase [Virgibacillus oceani]
MRGHIAKKGKKYYIVVDIGTGYERKQKWLSGFNTKKEAEKEMPRILNELNQGTYVEPSKQLYSDFLDAWMKNKRNKLSLNAYNNYEMNIRVHIKPALGRFKLSKLNSLAIDDFYTDLENKGLSSATIRKMHTIVRSSLEYAKDYRFIEWNPASVVKPPSVKHKDIQVWEEKDLMRFLHFTKNEHDYIVYHLALFTGMRRGEILGLKWSDIDYAQKKIRVQRSYSKSGFTKGKTDSARRVIDVDDDTITALKERHKIVKENKMRCGEDYEDNNLVVCRADGRPVDVRNVNRRFTKLRERHKMPEIRFHDMRHTHATIMLGMGTPVKIVSERMGHHKVEITLNTYAHLLPSMQLEAIQSFSDNMKKYKNAHSEK